MTIFLTESDVAYFDALIARVDEAVAPQRREILFRDQSAPRRNDCHANAARFAAETEGLWPAHGWLIEADDGDYRRFAAHSLLTDAQGVFIDITPLDPYSPRFVAHIGSSAAFFAMLPRLNSLTWPTPYAP